jgi:glutathione S-transferase
VKVYGYRNGRTLRVVWALEEAGAAYEYAEVDLFRGEAREPWFLAINPAGKVPVLIDGAQTIPESSAICLHIAEKYPEAALLPPAGTPERTQCYRWLAFVLTELDSALWTIAKHRFALPKEKRVDAVIETAAWEWRCGADLLAGALAAQPYLAGDAFSAADILAGHTLLWARSARLDIPSVSLERYLQTLERRSALTRAQTRLREAPSRSA